MAQSTNGRNHVTQYSYHGAGGQTASITQVDAHPEEGDLVTEYTYILTPGSGRRIDTKLPDATFQYQESNLLGQTTRQWGSQTNPVTFTYDAAGRMATHTTFRTPVTSGSQQTIPSSGDTTRWEYDPSGVLLRKIYADENKTTYSYDIAGRLATRAWARGVVTVYSYTAGQLTGIEYFGSVGGWENYRNLRATWQAMVADPANHTAQEISDAEAAMLAAKAAAIHAQTPAVSATYNRLGQLLTANQSGAATSPEADYTFGYNAASLRFASETVTIDADGSGPLPSLTRTIDRSRDNLQRPTGFVLGNEHAVGYGYDVSGRLSTISAQGLPNLPGKSHAFEYTYEPGSSLLDKVIGPVHEVDNTYEANRNVLSEKKNTRTVGTPGDLSIIGYTVNELGQRVQRNLSGEIRSDFYRDAQGNPSDPQALYPTGWSYDALGQVTSEDKPPPLQENEPDPDRGYSYDLIGNRLTANADSATTTYTATSLNQYTAVNTVNPVYDLDGNMTTGLLNGSSSGQFDYDGENQLIRTQSTTTSDPTKYAYDAFGRRIAKITYPNAGGQALAATLFIYDGWNLIAEYKLDSGAWMQDRTYIWGIDLSGATQGAGGVGGLLCVTKHQAQSATIFYPIYDGNGNIEAYLDSNGEAEAIYQYDVFGNILSGGGSGAAFKQLEFFHRFSSKYQDGETGLLYYGYRYCHTALGVWLSRDPIEEEGGLNIYAFIRNSPPSHLDILGLSNEGIFEQYFDWVPYLPGALYDTFAEPAIEAGQRASAVDRTMQENGCCPFVCKANGVLMFAGDITGLLNVVELAPGIDGEFVVNSDGMLRQREFNGVGDQLLHGATGTVQFTLTVVGTKQSVGSFCPKPKAPLTYIEFRQVNAGRFSRADLSSAWKQYKGGQPGNYLTREPTGFERFFFDNRNFDAVRASRGGAKGLTYEHLFIRQARISNPMAPSFMRGLSNSGWNSGLLIGRSLNSSLGNNFAKRQIWRVGVLCGVGGSSYGGFWLGEELVAPAIFGE